MLERLRSGASSLEGEASRQRVRPDTLRRWAEQAGIELQPEPLAGDELAARAHRAAAGLPSDPQVEVQPAPSIGPGAAGPQLNGSAHGEAPTATPEQQVALIVGTAEWLTRLSVVSTARMAKLSSAEAAPFLEVDSGEHKLLEVAAMQGLPILQGWTANPQIAAYVFLGLWGFGTVMRCSAVMRYGKDKAAHDRRARAPDESQVQPKSEPMPGRGPRSAADIPPLPSVGPAP
jgi:hypothetical protein